jgi:Saxitoxin biosynthesis operon protein SxtJ
LVGGAEGKLALRESAVSLLHATFQKAVQPTPGEDWHLQNGHHEQLTEHGDVKLPSDRSFGVTFAVVFTLFALWLYWRKDLLSWALLFLAAAVIIATLAYQTPNVLRPLNRVWMKFGLLLHKVINPLVMGLLFFLVFTPTGFIMRFLKKDLLRLERDPRSRTYWIVRSPETDPLTNMKNQY